MFSFLLCYVLVIILMSDKIYASEDLLTIILNALYHVDLMQKLIPNLNHGVTVLW